MIRKLSFCLMCGIVLLGVCGCGNKETEISKEEKITLTEYEERIYNFIIENDFYNQSEVRVVSGNSLYGFKLSAYNKVGGNISKCYDFRHVTETNIQIEESECGVYAHSDDVEGYEISVKNINEALKKYWEDRGY